MVLLGLYRKIMGYIPYKIMTIAKINKKKTDSILTTYLLTYSMDYTLITNLMH